MATGLGRVREFVDKNHLDVKLVEFDESTKSSALAAEALGCSVAEIAKTVVFVGFATVVVVTSGDRRVDIKKLSRLLGGELRMASANEVRDHTGYVAGGVPPFPHFPTVRVFPETSLRRFKKVWAAGGEQNAVFQISVDELVRMIGSEEIDVAS